MTPEEELAWWKIAFIHEAGHCIASIVRYESYDAITAQNDPTDPITPRKASYQNKGSWTDMESRPKDYLVLLCGGAAAEWLVLGQESLGFAGDRVKFYWLLPEVSKWNEQLAASLKELADDEIGRKFPRTIDILRPYRKALDAIAEAALTQFVKMGLVGKEFRPTVILSADDVKRVFEAASAASAREQEPAREKSGTPPDKNGG